MSEQSTNQTNQQTGMDRFFALLRGIDLRRRSDDRWIGGVCSGLADRLGVDPVIVRAGLVLLTLLGGFGVTLYLVGWALIPNDRNEIVAQRAVQEADAGSIAVVAFAALGLLGGSAFGGPWWTGHDGWGVPWGLVLTGLLIWWLVRRSGPRPDADQRVSSHQSGAYSSGTYSSGTYPSGTYPSGTYPSGTAVDTGSSPTTATPSAASGSPVTGQPTFGSTTASRAPVAPKKLRRRSGGPLLALLAIGLALSAYGSLIWAGSALSWTGDHQSIALAGSLAAMGLLLVGLGIAGWRAGFVAFLTIVLAIATWASTIVPQGLDVTGRVGDVTWAPASASAGVNPQSYRLGAGTGVLNLASLPTEGLGTVAPTPQIPVYVGVGDLEVRVPAGLTVQVIGRVGLGEIILPGETEGNARGGSGLSRSTVVGQGPTEVIVDAGVGLGTLTIVKE